MSSKDFDAKMASAPPCVPRPPYGSLEDATKTLEWMLITCDEPGCNEPWTSELNDYGYCLRHYAERRSPERG